MYSTSRHTGLRPQLLRLPLLPPPHLPSAVMAVVTAHLATMPTSVKIPT